MEPFLTSPGQVKRRRVVGAKLRGDTRRPPRCQEWSGAITPRLTRSGAGPTRTHALHPGVDRDGDVAHGGPSDSGGRHGRGGRARCRGRDRRHRGRTGGRRPHRPPGLAGRYHALGCPADRRDVDPAPRGSRPRSRTRRTSCRFCYESDDCSGPALLDAPPEVDGYAAAVIFDTGVFWPAGLGASRVVRSKATLVQEPTDCTDMLVAPQLCCAAVAGGETRLTAPVTGVPIADLHLRIPFRLEQGTTAVE